MAAPRGLGVGTQPPIPPSPPPGRTSPTRLGVRDRGSILGGAEEGQGREAGQPREELQIVREEGPGGGGVGDGGRRQHHLQTQEVHQGLGILLHGVEGLVARVEFPQQAVILRLQLYDLRLQGPGPRHVDVGPDATAHSGGHTDPSLEGLFLLRAGGGLRDLLDQVLQVLSAQLEEPANHEPTEDGGRTPDHKGVQPRQQPKRDLVQQ
mmetsp:Transcript_97413/g.167947  ORF Transcript_97413/g.167947 Transcript_97413/m.167947 type:complete len:208 (+) Transcript_97413:115-738(+)